MSGLDPIIASTLASRLDSVLSAVASGTSTATQTGTAQQAGVSNSSAANAPADPANAANPANPLPNSAEATLSTTALAVDAILRSDAAPPGPVVSPVPLIATPPGQPDVLVQTAATLVDLAGTSNAAVTTTLLNELGQALLGNTAAQNPAAALNAANGAGNGPGNTSALSSTTALNSTTALSNTGAATNNPLATSALAGVSAGATEPLVAALASALQQSVESSGLFYESHLAQWLVGNRSLADLLDEPQAQVTTTSQQAPAQAPAQNQSQAAPDTSGLASRLTASLASTLMGGNSAANAAASARGAAPSSALAQSLIADSATASNATQANNANNAASIVVNPQLLPLVRQQLEVLSEGQFRWAGEAWPGTPMDWEIERRSADGSAAGGADGMTWRTRISIELPSLGRVDAELALNAQQLSARIKAQPSGAATLVNGSADFRRRAAAAGLDLRAFQVLQARSATTAATVDAAATAAMAATATAAAAAATAATAAAGGERAAADEVPATLRLPGPRTS